MTVYINNREFIPLGNGIYQDKETGNKYKAKVILIDHGFSLPNKADSGDENSIILSRFAFSIWGDKIPDKFIDAIKKLKYSSFQQKLKKILDNDSIELFNKRIDDLLRGTAKVKDYKIVKKLKKK